MPLRSSAQGLNRPSIYSLTVWQAAHTEPCNICCRCPALHPIPFQPQRTTWFSFPAALYSEQKL